MPVHGKPAGIPCVQLRPDYPGVELLGEPLQAQVRQISQPLDNAQRQGNRQHAQPNRRRPIARSKTEGIGPTQFMFPEESCDQDQGHTVKAADPNEDAVEIQMFRGRLGKQVIQTGQKQYAEADADEQLEQ